MSASPPLARADLGCHLANGLRLIGWLAVNALVALGMLTTGMLALGNFGLADTMAQFANLASRFAAAPPRSRESFAILLFLAWSWSFIAVAYFRRATISRAWEQARGPA
jgi:hypothetical protein